MTQIIPFPRVRSVIGSRPRRVLTVGVETALGAMSGIPVGVVRMDRGLAVRYVPAWEVALRDEPVDLWVTPPVESDGCRAIAETIAGDRLDQDSEGRVWLNAHKLSEGALVATGTAAHEREGQLRLGAPAALLCARRDEGAFHFSVHITPAVLWVYTQPDVLAEVPVLDGWLRAAHLLWRDQEPG